MLDELREDAIVKKVGGRFKLCILIQRRLQELMEGSRPMVEREGRSDLEIVIEEILRDKIELALESTPDGESPAAPQAPLLT